MRGKKKKIKLYRVRRYMWKKKLESKSDIVSILDGVSHRNTLFPAQEK